MVRPEQSLWGSESLDLSEARKSKHAFTEAELEPLLIYNSQATFTQKTGSAFTQQYIWKQM